MFSSRYLVSKSVTIQHNLLWISYRQNCSIEADRRVISSIKKSSKVKIKCQPRIFSGIQPTGQIHLGNFFGAVKQWIEFQEKKVNGEYEHSIFSVVDLHAITLPQVNCTKIQLANLILQSKYSIQCLNFILCRFGMDYKMLYLNALLLC